MTIPLGSRVRWINCGVEHTGYAVQVVPAGEVPELPTGIAKHRRRFTREASPFDRLLVRYETITAGDLYYAPRVDSVTVVPVRIRKMARV